MFNKTFGRARAGSHKATSPLCPLTREDRTVLQRIKEGWYGNVSQVGHKASPNVGLRRRRALEKLVERRCLFLFSNSDSLRHQRMAVAIALCTPDKPCRIVVCSDCKSRFADYRVEQAWNLTRDVHREHIFWITVVCEPIYGGAQKVREGIMRVKAKVRDAIRGAARDDPRFNDIAWVGSFEIDLHDEDIDLASTKGRTLAAMEGFNPNSKYALQVIHFHLILTSNSLSREELYGFFGHHFPAPNQTLVKGIEADGQVEGHVQRMASYMSKCVPCYPDDEELRQSKKWKAGKGNKRFRRRLTREESRRLVYDVDHLLYHARLHEALGGLGGSSKFDRGINSRRTVAPSHRCSARQ